MIRWKHLLLLDNRYFVGYMVNCCDGLDISQPTLKSERNKKWLV